MNKQTTTEILLMGATIGMLTITIYLFYISFGNPEGKVLIATNTYGERLIETIALILGTIYTTTIFIKRLKERADQEAETKCQYTPSTQKQ